MSIDLERRRLIRLACALALGSAAALPFAKPKERVIKIVAKKFVYEPAQIRVKQGETVTLELTAPEVPMGFSLPDFALRTDVMPGQVARVHVTPDKAGTFTFLCDVFCGSGHEDMSGTLIVY